MVGKPFNSKHGGRGGEGRRGGGEGRGEGRGRAALYIH